jgi:hypothetical protein
MAASSGPGAVGAVADSTVRESVRRPVKPGPAAPNPWAAMDAAVAELARQWPGADRHLLRQLWQARNAAEYAAKTAAEASRVGRHDSADVWQRQTVLARGRVEELERMLNDGRA